jgi:hypothetical protein
MIFPTLRLNWTWSLTELNRFCDILFVTEDSSKTKEDFMERRFEARSDEMLDLAEVTPSRLGRNCAG